MTKREIRTSRARARVARAGRWIFFFALGAALVGCASRTAKPDAPRAVDILDERVPLYDDGAPLPELTEPEIKNWRRLIQAIERRVETQSRRKTVSEEQLLALKRRVNALVAHSLNSHRAFPSELENALAAMLARVDRAFVALRAPQYAAIVEVPMVEKSPTMRRRPFQFIWPVTGVEVSSPFGFRRDPYSGRARFHDGIDLAGQPGEIVFAAERGRVVYAGYKGKAGRVVILEHANGFKTFYAHLNDILTVERLVVERGQPIGLMGSTGRSTGSHLHFKITAWDQALNPEKFVGQVLE
ncbi:MAG: M23 family metallopeptidase [Myxococcales bacterium]|nr:MAG: M23 family metallopeptidase [Myxococcales bacterium]